MKNGLKIVVAGLIVALMAGCGSDDEVKKNVEVANIVGNWEGECDLNVTDNSSSQSYQEITDTKIIVRDVEFDNPTCDSSNSNEILHDMTMNFNYVLGEDFTTASEEKSTKMDATYTGLNVDVGTIDNGKMPVIGEKTYTIIYIGNSKLYTGKEDAEHNATSEATRPIKIDFTDPLEKI